MSQTCFESARTRPLFALMDLVWGEVRIVLPHWLPVAARFAASSNPLGLVGASICNSSMVGQGRLAVWFWP